MNRWKACSGLAFSPQGPLPDAISYWNYLSASYWVIDAFMMRDMAAATGRDAGKYQQMADSAKAYIKENFLNEDGTFKTAILNTMQTPALFALKNQLVEGEAKSKMIDRLRENFAQHDLCLQTGFLGTSILMATLTENGMEDIAYELLFQRKNPSLAVLCGQWSYHHLGTVEQLYDRQRNGTTRHEQLQSLCLRMCV